jgi:ABC-type Na+ efflux pump permease subunit
MKQFWTVLKFELGNYFKNKGFVTATVLIAIAIAAVITVPTLFMGGRGEETEPDDTETAVMAVADPDGIIGEREQFSARFPGVTLEFADSAEDVEAAVENGTAQAGFIVTGEDSYTCMLLNNSMFDTSQELFEQAMAWNYRDTVLKEQGIDSELVEEVYAQPMESETVILGKDSAQNYWYTYALVFLLYFLIMFYGQMIAVSVTTEKSNRAIEILVTSVDSSSLIFGKVLAGAVSGIIQAGIILGSALISYHAVADAWGHALDFLFRIPPLVWVTFLVFGLLGYLLYAFVFGMIGALVSKTEDISKSSGTIMIVYMASFFIAFYGMTMPDSSLVKLTSFIPFTSSNSMLIRVAMGTVAPWEIGVSAVILGASCVLMGKLAAKIFRFGTLMYGNPIKLSAAIKKIREK